MTTKPRNLSDNNVYTLPAPPSGNTLYGDKGFKGLALRVTAAGDRTFVRNYRIDGKQVRETLGPLQNKDGTTLRSRDGKRPLTLTEARNRAIENSELQQKPKKEDSRNNLKTVDGLWKYFEVNVMGKRAPRTQTEYRSMYRNWIGPEIGHLNTRDIELADMQALHNKISREGKTAHANRVLSLASVMFTEAQKHREATFNPVHGVERNAESRKPKALTEKQRDTLLDVLKRYDNRPHIQQIIKLLLWTGCRKGELFGARWDEFELWEEDGKWRGVWTVPAARTKQRKEHSRALLTNAVELLHRMQEENEASPPPSPFLFPSKQSRSGHATTIQYDWRDIVAACRELDGGFPQVGLHSLRHTFGTLLINAEVPLGMISGFMGHSNPTTTAIYAKPNYGGQERILDKVGDVLVGVSDGHD